MAIRGLATHIAVTNGGGAGEHGVLSPMASEFLLPVGVLIGITMWMAIRHAVTAHQAQRQSEIARRGSSCQGRVVAIQRPFMLDSRTRLYFDFEPPGAVRPLRVCHVDRRPVDEFRASLPAAGSIVTVHYLPDRPRQAVISRLVLSSPAEDVRTAGR